MGPDSVTDRQAALQRERDLYAEGLSELSLRYEQKIQELSLVRRMSDVLRDCSEMEELFRRLLGIVREELAIPACSLYLAEDSGDLGLRARCTRGQVEILRPGEPDAVRVAPGEGPLGQTFVSGQIQVARDVAPDTAGWFPAEARDLLTAPLGPASGCMGVLALHPRQADEVPPDVTRLLPILAMQATSAIENAALYQRLKRHSETLEARVRERTAALEHLNAELQASARQRSQFFAHFSHELRTPLNSILGFAEMLQAQMHGPLSEGQKRCVHHVYGSGTRLLRLINDIMDLAKVEAGKLSLKLQPVSLAVAVEQALAVMQPQAAAKHLRLGQEVQAALPRALADPARIHQILLNLLSNAIKFTPEGGAVTVTARDLAGPHGQTGDEFVEVAVLDTGAGIAPEAQARLFQDFEQVGGGDGQGTGLGLSLSRRLVTLHGGEIGMTSAPGQGSRFWFTLPLAGPAPEGAQA